MKVLHVIIALNIGGAELMLKRLVECCRRDHGSAHAVVSLMDVGKVGLQLEEMGVTVHPLGMCSALDIPRVLRELVGLIRATRPDIVQSWMYHANLLGGVAARIAGNGNVIWGIRGCAIPNGRLSATQLCVTLGALCSRWLPRAIVCCAESARVAHTGWGYHRRKMLVIPNGYHLPAYQRSEELRRQYRDSFGFSPEDVVIGTVGRFDPLKDYRNFVHAAGHAAVADPRVRMLMVGRDIHADNTQLIRWIKESGMAERFVLAGERDDIAGCLSALDVFCLSSLKEGFPNVVCEAMAMGVPCVVTDAGDAAEIVSDTGVVVAPGAPALLGEALLMMTRKGAGELSRLGEAARKRIEEQYTIERASASFESLYRQVLAGQ